VIIAYQFASSPAGSFPSAWDRFFGEGNFLERLYTARSLGMEADFRPGPAAFAGVLVGIWLLYGYFTPACFAREIKSPGKSVLVGSWGALLLTWLVLAVSVLVIQRLIPLEWLAAESFLYQFGDSSSQSAPWIMLYGAILKPNLFLVWLLGFAWVYTVLNLALVFLYTASRVILAWVQDRLLPQQIGYIHPDLKSHVIAILLVCIIAEFAVVEAALNGSLLARFNPLYFMVSIQLIPIAALILLPFLKPVWFASMPEFVRRRIFRIPVITVVGLITLAYLLFTMTAVSFTGLFGGIGVPTVTLAIIIFGSGLIWFYGQRYYQAAQGENIDLTFTNLPEE
jgi:basic amino acid/polyamine antiporter, APA family